MNNTMNEEKKSGADAPEKEPKADSVKWLDYDSARTFLVMAWTAAKACHGFLCRIRDMKKEGKSDGEIAERATEHAEEMSNVATIGLCAVDSMYDKYGEKSPLNDEELRMLGCILLSQAMMAEKRKDREYEKEEAGDGV